MRNPVVLAAACVATLVAGTAGGMVVTQSLRSEGPVVSDIRFKVNPDEYRACFRTPRDDTFEVAMVDSSERVVRILAEDVALKSDDEGDDAEKASAHCFDWDGLDQVGAPVPPGAYRLRVSLSEADRVAISGEKLTIVAPAPPGSGTAGVAEP